MSLLHGRRHLSRGAFNLELRSKSKVERPFSSTAGSAHHITGRENFSLTVCEPDMLDSLLIGISLSGFLDG